ncbi:AMP-binding protein [Rhodococcus chondri]|uniref:AMP-binding protein n=1 Tax=Rhodococcus chondri TaxID=3065941 RepID=A0ABU7JLM6_9NOCA|nr:AMP-binding protein [Rhodococcus sp. CC-R104]MEE2030622.1 AMP-binding protein [Rhodococcus sp. CC-R104]
MIPGAAHAPAYPLAVEPAPGDDIHAAFGDRTVPWLLGRYRNAQPGKIFLTWEPHTDALAQHWTYEEFGAAVDRLAAGLQARGIDPGDRVVLLMDNCPDFLVAWSAIVSIGAVAVCLNTRSSADELAYFDEHCAPRGAIVQTRMAETLTASMPGLSWLATTTGTEAFDDSVGTAAADGTLAQLTEIAPTPAPVVIDPLAPATIQYTSGTTARPKAVVWTHANCLWAGRTNAAHAGLRHDDVGLITLPLFHTNALGYSFLGLLWVGASIVLTPGFSASRFWDVSVRNRCTWVSVVSFMLRALGERPVPDDHCYRHWSGSSTVMWGSSGIRTTGWFGMTETVSHPVVSELAHPDPDGSMGRPAPEYAVAVVDEDGRPVETGTVGELWVRGTAGVSLFAGYYRNNDATREAFTSTGWFRTGDRVRQNHAGRLWYVERAKDMLKVGGENVAAAEVERVVSTVDGVREVAVVAAPDRMLGDVPVAFVIPLAHVEPDALLSDIEHTCAHMLADFKRPRRIHLVEEMPRSTLNKIAKARLRAWLAEPTGTAPTG